VAYTRAMTVDAGVPDGDAAGDDPSEPADLSDIDAVMAEFTKRMDSLRLDLDRITQNLDAIG
jgi:hypothetical protein